MANVAAAGVQAPVKRKAKAKHRGGIPLFRWLTQNIVWELFILACIIANAAILGYDAHFGETNAYHAQIEQWNMYFLWIFTAELVLEFFAQGPSKYFRSGWNIFDIIVVGLSYVAVNPAISALRTLRVVRVFRLISAVPQMRRVVEALFSALPGIMATFAILAIVFYIGAVMATTLFHNEPGFGDLGESALKLFALTQFDGWGDTINQLQPRYPWAWVFIMGFTIIAAFAVLNLFVGVIVEAVQHAPREAIQQDIDEVQEDVEVIATAQEDAAVVQQRILDEVRALRADVAALRGGGAPPA
ncbi:ion transporter [Terricaulis silvestris]|uniref:Ion transport protein n=1 Tax=Terricaulis silvestris TaxID=2686094 RepID=A0A6I6MT91_9CAUL|nr:ion transporter [Terricaulis silvestris]QGZ95987.1 Ion transport protein [Terricaulis silvestris]